VDVCAGVGVGVGVTRIGDGVTVPKTSPSGGLDVGPEVASGDSDVAGVPSVELGVGAGVEAGGLPGSTPFTAQVLGSLGYVSPCG
jgi:hypothetical protein